MHQIHELFLIFQHTDLFQNDVMPLLHGTLQIFFLPMNHPRMEQHSK